jgi:MFS family permease
MDNRSATYLKSSVAPIARMHAFADVVKVPARSAIRARWAVSLLFLVYGLVFGTWAAMIPSLQDKFHLSAGQLSWVLLGMIAGSMVSMSLTGKLIGYCGSGRLGGPAAPIFATTLLGIAFAPSYGALIAAAVFFGFSKGTLSVSINSQAITVENAVKRPIMGGFQGCWSLGGMVASTTLSALMYHGFSPRPLMIGMAIGLAAAASLALGKLLPDAVTPLSQESHATSRRGSLFWLGGLLFLGLFCEGVMFDWSAVYARVIGGMSLASAPMGFAVFALCTASGRFLGDFIVAKMGTLKVLRLSGLLMSVGIGLSILARPWPLILTGFALVGLGTANVVPILFGVAGRLKGHRAGASLATVATMGYFGFLAGPPTIGFIASWFGLPKAFALVIGAGIVIATMGVAIVRGIGKEGEIILCEQRS